MQVWQIECYATVPGSWWFTKVEFNTDLEKSHFTHNTDAINIYTSKT